MIIIKDKDTLIKALFSIDEQGIFKDINYFLDEKIIRHVSAYYEYKINDSESINFDIKKNKITSITFVQFNSNKILIHRSNDLPAVIDFEKSGEILLEQWFFNGNPWRENIFKPTSIEKSGESDYVFSYRIDKNSIISVSYILIKNHILIDGQFIINNNKVGLAALKQLIPDLTEITLNDCYDLSENIFTPELVNLYKMLYI